MKFTHVTSVVAALVLQGMTTTAQALPIVQTFEFGLPIVETPLPPNSGFPQDGVLGLFDSNLGTLTAATIHLSNSMTQSFTMTNPLIGAVITSIHR